MPLFEYRCEQCATIFEEMVPSAKADAVRCRQCGSAMVERLLSVFAVGRSTTAPTPAEPGPCGACGAPQRGMCGLDTEA